MSESVSESEEDRLRAEVASKDSEIAKLRGLLSQAAATIQANTAHRGEVRAQLSRALTKAYHDSVSDSALLDEISRALFGAVTRHQ